MIECPGNESSKAGEDGTGNWDLAIDLGVLTDIPDFGVSLA